MKNATYWMEYLERLAEGQEKGTIKPNQAVEMNNTAGKVISLAKASMDAYRAMEKTKGIAVIPALQYEQAEIAPESHPSIKQPSIKGKQ